MCWSCQASSLCCSAYSFVCPNSFISRLWRKEYNPTKKDPNPKFKREDRFWWSTHLSVHACDMIIISLLESKAWQKVGARWIAWQEFGRVFYLKKFIRPGHELVQHRCMDQRGNGLERLVLQIQPSQMTKVPMEKVAQKPVVHPFITTRERGSERRTL